MASAELEIVLKQLRESPVLPDDVSFQDMRAGMEASIGLFPLPEGLRAERVDVGDVPAEWIHMPESSPERTLLYLHGGGYCIGSINTHRGLVAEIARTSGCRALLLDYRLAPEHPFPAAVDDALAAWRFLLDQGCEPSRTSIAGDSAGGGLTLATLLAARDAGLPLPGAAACLSPWVDLEGLGESMTTRADEDPMVQREGLLRMAGAYLGDADPRTPLAAPLHGDLAGLPPLLIQVGTAETLLDDSTRLAERARTQGVDVSLEIWEEMIHVFQAFGAVLPEAREAVAQIGEFLRKRTG